ncbi:uncharacterized protein LOC118409002 isoform X2 [Branchiostoma floridae]|uniref:Uncharacterized protein LOC118409002 isoform X2 n=1 Tax=Branchiostoma floridae TaxID=7739 RepID=A0A9J7HXJ6_BRAFL|nr:uncharacterized protein LOC118409002 isoform X2 [Branchiostoma floridae]
MMSTKRQAPDHDQPSHHGRGGQLRKRGRTALPADDNVEIINVDDDEEEEDWLNMTMSKHTHNQSMNDDRKLKTYSARGARAERRQNKQNQQEELIPEDELMFDSQLQKALALSKQEAEKSTFQQQAEEEELQKILEQSKVETGTPVRAARVETAAGGHLSPHLVDTAAPVSPAQIDTPVRPSQFAPVKPIQVEKGTPVRAAKVDGAAPVSLAQTETPVKPNQVEKDAPVKPIQMEKGAPVKPIQIEKGAPVKTCTSAGPAQVVKGVPVEPAQAETAAITPAKPAKMETGASIGMKSAQVETAAGAKIRQAKTETAAGANVRQAKIKTAAGASVSQGQVKTKIETAAGANVRQTQMKTAAGANVRQAKVKTAEDENVRLENGTAVQPAQLKTGADIRCNSHIHGEMNGTKKQQQGRAEEEKGKKHQAKVKRRRQICLDHMECGDGERWLKKRRVVYHHGNFVRRPGVDTAKQTNYIIKCLENYRLKLHQAQRRQLTKLEWGKPLVEEDDTKTRSRRRKGTWTAISAQADVDNSQPADKDTQNGTLGVFEEDDKDGILDMFGFDTDTQNGIVSSALGSQGHSHDVQPEENTENIEKIEDFERPDSTSFEIDILDNPSPEHKPVTRSLRRNTSSPVVMGTDTPDAAESLETEETTQVGSPQDKSEEEKTSPTHHGEDVVTMAESQEISVQDEEDQSARRTLRPRSTKQLKITDVVLTDESEKSDNDNEDSDFLQRIERRQNLKRPPLHRLGRGSAPALKQKKMDQAVRNGTGEGSTRTEAISEQVMKSCLICGKEVPEDELQEHINNELDNST